MNITIENKTNLMERSIDLILKDEKRDIKIQFDYLRCVNICLTTKDKNKIEDILNKFKEISNYDTNDYNVVVVDCKEAVESYKEVIELKTDIPSLVILDLTKLSPVYITNLLIQSLITGLNVLMIVDENYIKGGYFMLPFGEPLNNTDNVQGIVRYDLEGKVTFNTSSFVG